MPIASHPSPSHQGSHDAPADAIRKYWNERIHDVAVTAHPVGSAAFFEDLSEYRFDKLRYLPQVVDFSAYSGTALLEIGCGVGIDLVRFARGGASVTGIDLAETAIALARANFQYQGLPADLRVMDGQDLQFDAGSFDTVYAHGVLPYAAHPARIVDEIYRVLRPGGEAILMVYNRHSWLNLMSKLARVDLEHQDAPGFWMSSVSEFRRMLRRFQRPRFVIERFPIKTRIHSGLKAGLFNQAFLPLFRLMPRSLIRPFGWHIVVFAQK